MFAELPCFGSVHPGTPVPKTLLFEAPVSATGVKLISLTVLASPTIPLMKLPSTPLSAGVVLMAPRFHRATCTMAFHVGCPWLLFTPPSCLPPGAPGAVLMAQCFQAAHTEEVTEDNGVLGDPGYARAMRNALFMLPASVFIVMPGAHVGLPRAPPRHTSATCK